MIVNSPSYYSYVIAMLVRGGEGGAGDPNFCLHISSSWVKIRLYTENQLPRLPGSVLKVRGGAAKDKLCSSTKLLVELIWVVTIKCYSVSQTRFVCTHKHRMFVPNLVMEGNMVDME